MQKESTPESIKTFTDSTVRRAVERNFSRVVGFPAVLDSRWVDVGGTRLIS
jgi:hypothetical protein